ncbi:MAG: hypothetical protein UX04_C0002G0181 [Microgenomates group bacterium GW2011_GWF2_45_18]|nr:MAG: hypothetical protein UW18_C0009G0010 [Microgenomates group bacterium GW2011_GWF1_44_10]KKU02038.1 MAG: hypothetical protein UX04_C0002G0181 [Microgenomates group bacterium GW2011_GWF2_45_18]HAU99306.1 hypothetical protein [Candidatus Paceibacterota bacterium]HAX01517.1 hypothetical protein [Candidatus Paceibacterota bacterium]
MKKLYQKCMKFALEHEWIVIILFIAFLLRIPNVFEPYWYGDEAIYLTIGQAMRKGIALYSEIIDHKTPLIYVLAMVTYTQFWFKLFFIFWGMLSLSLFASILRRLRVSSFITGLTTFFVMLLTTLPSFEGNIGNGELFVAGFVLIGLRIFIETQFFQSLAEQKPPKYTKTDRKLLFLSGFFFGLGMLTKVPALFDAVAVGWIFLNALLFSFSRKNVFSVLMQGIWFGFGVIFPIAVSILYFLGVGSGSDYYSFGLAYNFRYSGEFGFPFEHSLLVFLYSMKGKLLILSLIGAFSLLYKKSISFLYRFGFVWTSLAFFASMLSSRPYPHYLLQVMFPLLFLLGISLSLRKVIAHLLSGGLGISMIATLFLFHFGLYPTVSYYQRFFRYAFGTISVEEYRSQFNPLMQDTYHVANFLQEKTVATDRIFVWGTNPMLYALSQRSPADRFTVSFHIKDFDAFSSTLENIQKHKPTYIIVMNEEQDSFEELRAHISLHYTLLESLQYMKVYRYVQ